MMMGTVYDVILHYQHTELSHHPGHRTDDSSTSSTTTTTARVGSDQQQLEQVLIVACHYRWGDEGGLVVDIGGGGGGWCCDGEAAFTASILIFITIANELMDVDEPNTQQTPAYELNSHIYNRSHHTDR